MHLQKVQLCLVDQHHQGVQSGPVREGEQKHRQNPDESSDIYVPERREHMALQETEFTPLIGPVTSNSSTPTDGND